MKKAAVVLAAFVVAVALSTLGMSLFGHLAGRPREVAEVARDATRIAVVAYPAGLALAWLLVRRRRNGRAG